VHGDHPAELLRPLPSPPLLLLHCQPGKLVGERDASPEVLSQLEAAYRAAPPPSAEAKKKKK
jgi:hypothetical protein